VGAQAGATGHAGSSGHAGAAGSAGAGGAPSFDPDAERAAAEAEATSRCEGLGGWSTLTWLSVGADSYSTYNEGTELVHGLPGDDDITMGWGTFCALGGKGNDTLRVANGALTNTTIVGGEGADRFVYAIETLAQRNIYYSDFETGQDKWVFAADAIQLDSTTPIRAVEAFDGGTMTPANSPAVAFTVVVVAPPSGAGQVWLTNHNEGVQSNYLVGYLGPVYPVYSASDFELE
jgi:Ca2+-binding RTX toxin-like protein